MKKQVLVSVDRGETRVALLETTGTVAPRRSGSASTSRRRRKPGASSEYKVAELYLERRGLSAPMIGAVLTQLLVLDPVWALLPAAYGVLFVIIAWYRRPQAADLLARLRH